MRRRLRDVLSVSPLLCPTISTVDSSEDVEKGSAMDDEIKNLKDHAVLGERIVGIEKVTLDERGQGALSPRMMPSPREPTPAARARASQFDTFTLRALVSILCCVP